MRDKKGFTLVEMLIVVAIIGILTSVAIPVYSSSMEKSRTGVCQANRRALQSLVYSDFLVGGHSSLSAAFQGIYQGAAENDFVCPRGGTYTWEDSDASGHVVCSIHGSGGAAPGGESPGNGDGNSGTGGNGDHGGGGGTLYPGTSLTVSSDYWPDPNDTTKYPTTSDVYYLQPGGIFLYGGEYWVVTGTADVTYSRAQQGPNSIYGWFYSHRISGRIVTFVGEEQLSGLSRGDMCRIGDDYYVFIDGGTRAYSPIISPDSWYKLPY